MSVDLSSYNMTLIKGDTFSFHFIHKNANNIGINLDPLGDGVEYTASMQIRRSKYTDKLIGEVTEANYPTGSFGLSGGNSVDFSPGYGKVGSHAGGIILNQGNTAGAITVIIDSDVTKFLPIGRNVYDFQLTNTINGDRSTILSGDFNVIDRGSELDSSIVHYGGDRFKLEFEYKNSSGINASLAGYSAEMHIMKSPNFGVSGGSGPSIHCRAFEGYPLGVDGRTYGFYAGSAVGSFVGTTSGGIKTEYGGTAGNVYIEIAPSEIAKIPSGRNYYAIRVLEQTTGEVITLREGNFDLSKDVTR